MHAVTARCMALCGCVALLVGCATPAQRADQRAAALGFDRFLLTGARYQHVAYFKPAARAASTLHVYLEHDGSPWVGNERIAADPTPRNLLMLSAMARDPAPSLYLGRPCYFGQHQAPGCGPRLWTHERYSEAVVHSLATALGDFLVGKAYSRIGFFGYSGGGTLAMLLAERFAQTDAVVTVAANLDLAAWARLHDYSELTGSLDPATRQPLPERVPQLHYLGERDAKVPPAMLRAFAQRPNTRVVVVPAFDHVCCWEKWWPNALRDLEKTRARP